jgi:acyl-CoA thioesterase-1
MVEPDLDDYVRQFESMYPALAERYETAIVPFFMADVAMNPALMQADGVHPAVEAQPVLLDNLWPTLEPLLTTE